MGLIDRLSSHELKELISKCWITHDGMWFAHTLFESGIETTNHLNRAAIKSMAAVELERFMKVLAVSKTDLQSFPAFVSFFSDVADILIPDFMNVTISFDAPNTVRWEFNERGCFAFNGVKMLSVEKDYECGVLYRIQCWLDILEISFEMTPAVTHCVMPKNGECKGMFRLWPPNESAARPAHSYTG